MFDRVLAVALREYRAAVQTKAFLVSLLLMPLILAVSVGVQLFATTAEAGKTRTYAVVDRTARLREPLEQALSERSRENLHDPAKLALSGSFRLEFVEPSASARAAVLEQRLALTERHERGEIEGILEIGAAVFELPPAAFEDAEAAERHSVRFQSNKLIGLDFSRWSERAINDAVHTERLRARGISADLVRQLEVPVPLHVRAGTRKDPHTGQIEDASEVSRVASFFVPGVLVLLMFMMVLLGAVPAMQGLVEEKQQRIAEVLLGCVPPFQLMLGKLIGMIAVSLTVALVYLAGGYAVAAQLDASDALSASVLLWFALFTVLASLIYGSLFLAIGAAASDMKETQSLQTPVVMIASMPLLLLTAVLRDPDGTVAVVGSFFPFSAPMLMVARLASPSGVPWWHPVVAAVLVLGTALASVWAASRVFRVGLLLQGKAVRFSDLARWVLRG